jgi:hypothetical protein
MDHILSQLTYLCTHLFSALAVFMMLSTPRPTGAAAAAAPFRLDALLDSGRALRARALAEGGRARRALASGWARLAAEAPVSVAAAAMQVRLVESATPSSPPSLRHPIRRILFPPTAALARACCRGLLPNGFQAARRAACLAGHMRAASSVPARPRPRPHRAALRRLRAPTPHPLPHARKGDFAAIFAALITYKVSLGYGRFDHWSNGAISWSSHPPCPCYSSQPPRPSEPRSEPRGARSAAGSRANSAAVNEQSAASSAAGGTSASSAAGSSATGRKRGASSAPAVPGPIDTSTKFNGPSPPRRGPAAARAARALAFDDQWSTGQMGRTDPFDRWSNELDPI